jgi:hypothetical protein
MHAYRPRRHFIGESFIDKEQGLGPLPFLGAVFPPVDDVVKNIFLIFLCRTDSKKRAY